LYEFVRQGRCSVSRQLLTETLLAVDHCKALLADPGMSLAGNLATHQQINHRIKEFIEKIDGQELKEPLHKHSPGGSKNTPGTYYILFRPQGGILASGTNPLYLLDELSQLGHSRVIARTQQIPDLENLDPSLCYTYWEILLATRSDEQAIREVFMFVETESTLDIQWLYGEDLLLHPSFLRQLETMPASPQLDVASLMQGVASASAIPGEKVLFQGENLPKARESAASSIRVASDKLDGLMNLVSELVTTQARLSLFARQNATSEVVAIAETVEKLTRQLRDNTFSMCLIPLETMVMRFQRLVRDLSGKLGKDVAFITEGMETELDKTMIEHLADPLLHILRNCVDHGIEEGEKRLAKGKPKGGKILLKAFYSGACVCIQVEDDGAGIDPEKVRQKAISKGMISPEAVLSEKEILDLIFLPGFSTAAQVTDVSGRGVGMDVVRRSISDLRGEVHMQSRLDEGTCLTIKLPLTLSVLDGLLVRIAGTHYVIPLSAVDKCYEVAHSKLITAFNNLIVLDGEQVPFFYLRDEFEEDDQAPSIEQVVVVRYGNKRVGLAVDAVIGEHQAVLKPLGKLYRHQEMISGASILGNGTIALVMDTSKIVKHCASAAALSTI
jgi:two-component system chemotaxis sensor kinase CheA